MNALKRIKNWIVNMKLEDTSFLLLPWITLACCSPIILWVFMEAPKHALA